MNPVRVLLLEDSEPDAELTLAHLADGGISCEAVRVGTRDEFIASLTGSLDVILADYSLPGFDGLAALRLARESRPEVPFLFVSGAMGDERAVEALKEGATDYILKDRPARLAPCVRRALREAEERAERRRLQEALAERARQLAEADRRKDEFLAMLAHELRNPLSPIRNAVQLMRLRGVDDPSLVWARDVVERQVTHLTRLLDSLLDVAYLTRGRIELRTRSVPLADVVARAVESARPAMEARSHTLSVELSAGAFELNVDPDRLAQAFANLLDNAARFTDPGGRVELSGAIEGGELVVRIRDNGRGMGPDLLPRVFELFAQADRPLDRSDGGLGVGLTLARGLIELHGGRLTATSDGLGLGSTLTARFPTGEAGSVTPTEEIVFTPPAIGRSRSVLVVDDNVQAAATLRVLLQLWGHRVRLAVGAAEAVAAVASFAPDAIVVDLALPGVDGYDLGQRLRAQAVQETVLIGLTGYGQSPNPVRAREAGFAAHLAKPLDPEALQGLLG